jgi:hypothetical protein
MADPLRDIQARLDSPQPLEWGRLEQDARWLVADVSLRKLVDARQALLNDADVLSDEKQALLQQLSP